MVGIRQRTIATILAALLGLVALEIQAQGKVASADPLPSWNDTSPKKAIVAFVERVTKKGSPDFVSNPERIATFDNDGTLWSEQPAYFQGFFVFDRVKALAPRHPEWKTQEPFASIPKATSRRLSRAARRRSAS